MTPEVTAATQDIVKLTSTIQDAQAKPMLRNHLVVALTDLGHPYEAAKQAADAFFHSALH